jgi:hypothetical protein
MRRLDRSREYLLWYERHRERWVAVPIAREGAFIETDYASVVVLPLLD